MPEQSRLPPCPFCGGPPKATVTRVQGGGSQFPDSELEAPGGLYVEAVVFCHECGAEGPGVREIAHNRGECHLLQAQAQGLWTQRDQRNKSLYESSIDRDLVDYRSTVRERLEPYLVDQFCGLRRHQVTDAIRLLLDYIDARAAAPSS